MFCFFFIGESVLKFYVAIRRNLSILNDINWEVGRSDLKIYPKSTELVLEDEGNYKKNCYIQTKTF